MSRLPNDYELKSTSTSGYFKITEEPQEFRILTSPVIGWEYFTEKDGKPAPVRQRGEFDGIPADCKDGSKPKEFRAFVVWNHTLGRIQIMEITQQSIKNEIWKLAKDEENRGDPKGYDLKVEKTGKGKETRYSLSPLPKSKFGSEDERVSALDQAKAINLDALFDGDDPFKPF